MDTILEVTLDADFLAAAEAADREPSALLADPMRDFVEHERSAYSEFLRRKVKEGRRCIENGEVEDAEVVEAEFSALRRDLAAMSRSRP